MKKAGRWLAFLMAAVVCLGLTACEKELDAAGYTKSVLDASYKGEYAKYAGFRDISEEEAKKEVQDIMEEQGNAQLDTFGDIDEAIRTDYLECLSSVDKLAKYEVKESEKQEDGSYIVQVEVTPAQVYLTLTDTATALLEELPDEERLSVTEDENAFAQFMIQCLNKAAEENTYGETSTIEVVVAQGEDKAYGIDTAQMEKIDAALFPQD